MTAAVRDRPGQWDGHAAKLSALADELDREHAPGTFSPGGKQARNHLREAAKALHRGDVDTARHHLREANKHLAGTKHAHKVPDLDADYAEALAPGRGEQPPFQLRAAFDPAKHPRGYHGRWAHEGGSVPFSRSGDTVSYKGSLGIDRKDMPQLSGLVGGQYVPTAHMMPKFLDYLRSRGINAQETTIPAGKLRPTQTTGSHKAIRGIADALKDGSYPGKRITVSQDNRVMDGHHNWAGLLVANSEGHKGDQQVLQVGLPARELLAEMREFAKREGIASRKQGEHANPEYATRWNPLKHPRVPHGEHGGEFARAAEDNDRASDLHGNASDIDITAYNGQMVEGRVHQAATALQDGEYERAAGLLRQVKADLGKSSPSRNFRDLHRDMERKVDDHLAYAEKRAKEPHPDYGKIRQMEEAAGIGSPQDREHADALRADQEFADEWAPGSRHLAAAARALEQSDYPDALNHLDALYQQVNGAGSGSPRLGRLLARLNEHRDYVRQKMAEGLTPVAARASVGGRHVPGTPYEWRHGWEALSFEAAKSHYHNRVPPYWRAPGQPGPDRRSGAMKHGDWLQGHQAVGPAPVGVLGRDRGRYVDVPGEKHKHLVQGSYSDPWWMTDGRGGWAVSQRWQHKAQQGYDWSGQQGRARTFPIPAADERVLTKVDKTGTPLSEGEPLPRTREFPVLDPAVAHAEAKAKLSGAQQYLTESGGKWHVSDERPSMFSAHYFTVSPDGVWKQGSRSGMQPVKGRPAGSPYGPVPGGPQYAARAATADGGGEDMTEAPQARQGRPGFPSGLMWDAAEALLLTADTLARFDPDEPRGPGGKWAKVAGGAATASTAAAAAGPAEPSPREIAKMVADLRSQMDAERSRMQAEHAAELRQVTDQLRAEQARLAGLAHAGAVSEAERQHHHKEVVNAVVTVLGLVAAGLLIIATAGMALPPLAEAGVAVGPLIGSEALKLLRKRGREHPGAAGGPEPVAGELGKLVAKTTGAAGDEAQQVAEQLLEDARQERAHTGAVRPVSRAFNPRELRDRTGKWSKTAGAAAAVAQAADTEGEQALNKAARLANPDLAAPKPGGWSPAARALVAESSGNDSVAKYMNPDGTWSPERQRLHEKIVAEALAGVTPSDHPVATFLGGGTASGKSTALAGRTAGNEVHIDSDALKGKLPDYQDMTKAGDPKAAAFAHEESSYLAKVIQAQSIATKRNFLLDGTGDASWAKMSGKLAAAKAAGYRTSARYATVDTDEAIRRAEARAKKTGRMVPPAVIAKTHASVSEVFSHLVGSDLADDIQLWDTNGPKAVLVGEKRPDAAWSLKDRALWDRFLAKAAPQVSRAVYLTSAEEPGLDEVDLARLVSEAEAEAALMELETAQDLSRFNPFHAPPGTSAGGEFASGPGGSGGPEPKSEKQAHAKEAKRLRAEAGKLRDQARRLAEELRQLVAQLHASVAAARHSRAQAHKAAAAAKSAASKAKHPGAAQKRKAHSAKGGKTAKQHHAAARAHTTTAVSLRKRIATMRTRIRGLRERANALDAKAAKL